MLARQLLLLLVLVVILVRGICHSFVAFITVRDNIIVRGSFPAAAVSPHLTLVLTAYFLYYLVDFRLKLEEGVFCHLIRRLGSWLEEEGGGGGLRFLSAGIDCDELRRLAGGAHVAHLQAFRV